MKPKLVSMLIGFSVAAAGFSLVATPAHAAQTYTIGPVEYPGACIGQVVSDGYDTRGISGNCSAVQVSVTYYQGSVQTRTSVKAAGTVSVVSPTSDILERRGTVWLSSSMSATKVFP